MQNCVVQDLFITKRQFHEPHVLLRGEAIKFAHGVSHLSLVESPTPMKARWLGPCIFEWFG